MLKEMNLEDIECGNLFFGHSRGSYIVPREKWQEKFIEFLEKAGFDFYGHMINDENEKYVRMEKDYYYLTSNTDITPEEIMENGKFSHLDHNYENEFYYYNDELYCIFKEVEEQYFLDYDAWSDRYLELPDDEFDDLDDWLNANDLNLYTVGDYKGEVPEDVKKCLDKLGPMPDPSDYQLVTKASLVRPVMEHNHYFDNGTFLIRPYYWGDGENIKTKPNFVYYPEGIAVSWYKYPLRDSYINTDINYDEFCDILDNCLESLKGGKDGEVL